MDLLQLPPTPPLPGYQTQLSAGRSLSRSTNKDVGWTEEVLGEANKYIKFPAGSGDKGSGDRLRHRCMGSCFAACPRWFCRQQETLFGQLQRGHCRELRGGGVEGREGAVSPGDEFGRDRPDKKEYDGS